MAAFVNPRSPREPQNALVFTSDLVVLLLVVPPDSKPLAGMYQREARSWEQRDATAGLTTKAEFFEEDGKLRVRIELSEPASGQYDAVFSSDVDSGATARLRGLTSVPHMYAALFPSSTSMIVAAEALRSGKAHGQASGIFARLDPKVLQAYFSHHPSR